MHCNDPWCDKDKAREVSSSASADEGPCVTEASVFEFAAPSPRTPGSDNVPASSSCDSIWLNCDSDEQSERQEEMCVTAACRFRQPGGHPGQGLHNWILPPDRLPAARLHARPTLPGRRPRRNPAGRRHRLEPRPRHRALRAVAIHLQLQPLRLHDPQHAAGVVSDRDAARRRPRRRLCERARHAHPQRHAEDADLFLHPPGCEPSRRRASMSCTSLFTIVRSSCAVVVCCKLLAHLHHT